MYSGHAGQQFGGPSPYGAVDYEAGQRGFGSTSAADGQNKAAFLRGRRRRMNIQPLFLCILAPWALFSVLYAVMSFELRYEEPVICGILMVAGALIVLTTGIMACTSSSRFFSNPEREPTWLAFLFLSMVVALAAAFILGNGNYSGNMQRYYNMRNLNNYSDISVSRMRGQQLMDAGIIGFTNGTKLDISKSSGFKNQAIYCVAPITVGDETLATYDFWAVGKDCCSGTQANFHCPNFNNPHANGGLRLMSDGDRPYYRLAVQQAEATYNIKAVHPLFFEWIVEPAAEVDSWKQAGRSEYLVWILSYLVFQTFLVAFAALLFSKMGFN
mmetsp:Transcript_68242/g.142628  ORF Transcript_68242/g.142628 Transcript_68242/m.142628 type:complete len:328 (+) Transcript_68242:105-1088(+)